ncbi:hypothetical protein [Polyangium jinanense]|uniref:Uncharacterized protein n=1 Tax=Polyangium jinanense TaxID=2829994 RepID=A0A9X3XIF8_9BACT|nr:hypothetical protein [Polyangium jinanense]MDC3962065.1 hypothetical protein [Polyangium jinanense]MDC3988781.1 hypothetical protein [Polyangium jinanense]
MAAPLSALADVLVPNAPDTNGIRAIGKGIKEIGAESLLVLNYSNENNTSSIRTTNITGLSFRYFILNNLNLALNASYFYKGVDAAARQGGMVTLGGNYLINIGRGLFLNPGLAGGGFYGKVSVKGAPSGTPAPTMVGGVARAGFGLAFYASPKFSLFARPEAVLYVGKVGQGPTESSLLNVDGGFNVGMNYVF